MDGEWAMGSTPGSFLYRWVKIKGIDSKTVNFDRDVPQIKLIPQEDLPRVLLADFEMIDTPEKRAEIDADPRMKRTLKSMFQQSLAEIDWAEQTYGIRIDVAKEICEWLAKR